MAEDAFDITDGRNLILPCPGCQSSIGMGLVSRKGQLAIECADCGHRGPGIKVPEVSEWSSWPISSKRTRSPRL